MIVVALTQGHIKVKLDGLCEKKSMCLSAPNYKAGQRQHKGRKVSKEWDSLGFINWHNKIFFFPKGPL